MQLLDGLRRELWDLQPALVGQIRDDIARAARWRHHAHAASRQRLGIASQPGGRQEIFQRRDADNAELTQRGVVDGIVANQRAGMSESRA